MRDVRVVVVWRLVASALPSGDEEGQGFRSSSSSSSDVLPSTVCEPLRLLPSSPLHLPSPSSIMSAPASAAGDAAAAGQGEAGAGWGKMISRGLLMYFIVNAGTAMLKQKLGPQETAPAHPSTGEVVDAVAAGSEVAQTMAGVGGQPGLPSLQVMKNTSSRPFWKSRDELDFYVFFSSSAAATHDDLATQYSALVPGGGKDLAALGDLIDFAAYPSLSSEAGSTGQSARFTVVQPQNQESFPILKAEKVTLSDISLVADVTLHAPTDVLLNNGSIWADVVAVPSGADVRNIKGYARTRKSESNVGLAGDVLISPLKSHRFSFSAHAPSSAQEESRGKKATGGRIPISRRNC